jgi:hypothetical protein
MTSMVPRPLRIACLSAFIALMILPVVALTPNETRA